MSMHRSVHILFLITILIAASSCSENKRYAVLSFFFDGVPRPGDRSDIMRKGRKKAPKAGKKFYQHGPYAAKLCTGCHESGSNVLIMPKEELCIHCHVLPADVNKLHGPLAAGGCTVCHDPHGTANPAFLLSDAEQFCLFCHSREDVMKSAVHRDVDATCISCHDAHGGNNDFLLKPGYPGAAGKPA